MSNQSLVTNENIKSFIEVDKMNGTQDQQMVQINNVNNIDIDFNKESDRIINDNLEHIKNLL